MKKILLLTVLSSFIACSEDDQVSDDLMDQMNAVYLQIEQLVITSCTSSDQCIATPIGVKPCGGPTRFIVHSSSTDQNQLETLIEKYNELNAEYNRVNELGSDCSVETPPAIDCVSGECQSIEG